MSFTAWFSMLLVLVPSPVAAAPVPPVSRLGCLLAGYGGAIGKIQPGPGKATTLILRTGQRFTFAPASPSKPSKLFALRLETATLADQVSQLYPAGPRYRHPAVDDDPGRLRHQPFFQAIYGATPAEVRKNLVTVRWPGGKRLAFNARNGAAAALSRVSTEIARLSPKLQALAARTAGTFVWREIKGTRRLSAHSFGIAVDVAVGRSDYWRWGRPGSDGRLPYKNRIPLKIVEAFERHGFIWGGKWYHYDTMHFEYRPELLHPACVR